MKEKSGHRFEMTVDMSVLESLGINLYSNAAAVLSELVANAWDADATTVSIEWKVNGELVVISDDGRGMTDDEINNKFLKVGYKKRPSEGTYSPRWRRAYMGRKGIGKLSVFSIADRVHVYTVSPTSMSGLEISVNALRDAIMNNVSYHPSEIGVPDEFQRPGTTIVLSDLKSKRADLTVSALRKRLARRFDVLDPKGPESGGFAIFINGSRITYE